MPAVDFVALSLLPYEWRRTIGDALRQGRAPGDLIAELLSTHPGRASRTLDSLRARAAAVLARGQDSLRVLPWTDPEYPALLAAICDPPPALWVRGRIETLSQPAVAIVGSRAGSPYALAVAERLSAELASAGVVVISGLARGVDSAAHRGALEAAGLTIGVLGSGVNIVYPAEHRALADRIAASGAVLSELVPGTQPLPFFFPLRNRIISGLSRAVVVIEAGEKSGSLITARCALEQGRDVLAVPGNVLNGRNRGGHALLRDGAKVVESAVDILEELGLQSATTSAEGKSRDSRPEFDPVLEALPIGEPRDLDAIAERSGLTPSRLLTRLFTLELEGRVARAGGGRFMRLDRTC